VFGLDPVKQFLQWLVDTQVTGPDANERANAERATSGERRGPTTGAGRLSRPVSPHLHTTTVETALAVAERTLDGDAPTGFQTPAGAYGPDLILDVPGTEREDVV